MGGRGVGVGIFEGRYVEGGGGVFLGLYLDFIVV